MKTLKINFKNGSKKIYENIVFLTYINSGKILNFISKPKIENDIIKNRQVYYKIAIETISSHEIISIN